MTEKEYRSHPAISRSELWRMSESPEKFKWFKDHPPESTPTFTFGQVVHKFLLEYETFEEEFAIIPYMDRRTKEGKAKWEQFLVESQGRTPVSQDDIELAAQMVDVVKANPLAAKLLSGQHEVPFFWTDEMTGIDCKCRTDCLTELSNGQLVIVDYKTCSNASNDSFMRDAIKFGYTMQAAMYSDGVQANEGKKPLFVFIAQEKTAPFSVNIFQAEDAFVQLGRDQYREFLGMYRYCKESGDWYGYLGKSEIINTLSIPSWMAKE